MNELQETAIALQQDYGLQVPDEISEETILKRLAERVAVLVDRGAEAFFQMMYRLDISERKLNEAIGTPDVAEKIARLIYDRQLQKIRSRAFFKGGGKDVDQDLKW
ncbi:hypothetical protein CJD36_012950 [Flavipsychrobacter stenotrophus]|uniref:Uncharacterized protein n=1 Tax=Flavipsychrobacter stenotrophus TaxID=2077091 RepID=A0A2S7SVE7_9BACT|nr:hypothetical protein [Flavipsychrobacter stenotrophus]PQJ10873.1 hypothetical protein CJD36_012950 [Flavipsychrobacter stenotrophus]